MKHDYMDIVKRAWAVTWRYKILWLFGLFAGAGSSSGGSSGSGGSSPSGGGGDASAAMQQVEQFIERNVALIVAAVVFLMLLGILWWIVSVAARGGIVKLVDDAEERRGVTASEGWRVGFDKWFTVFGISFLAGLPAALLGLIIVIAIVGAIGAGTLAGKDAGGAAAVILSALGGTCLLIVVLGLAAAAIGVIFAIVKELAVRYAVLEGRGVMDSLRAGWSDLWQKRGAFLMYLVLVVAGIVAGLALGLVAIAAIVPAAIAFIAGSAPVGIFLGMLGILVLMLPAAIWSTFYHAVWTIFFRRMTGRETLVAASVAPTLEPVPGIPAPPAAYADQPAGDTAAAAEGAAPAGSGADPWIAANTVPADAAAGLAEPTVDEPPAPPADA